MKLSVIVIAYDMAREIPRTLQGLARSYQHGAAALDYEVLLVDNGSPSPLEASDFGHIDVPLRLIRIDDAHPSPAAAINLAARQAAGEIVCLMIDGAHLLTPGVFKLMLTAFRAFDQPVVGTRYFYMGPDEQNTSIAAGYDKAEEDRLLRVIDWPHDGYRLFEVGAPLRAGPDVISWINKMFESNCLFMHRALFDAIGGADERFDLPGGGFLNLDLYKRACDAPGVVPVQLLGEGSFHQLHGGTTTNVSMEARRKQTETYRRQYITLRQSEELMTNKDVYYLGHQPTLASKIARKTYPMPLP